MNAQAELNFDLAEPDVRTLVDMVEILLSQGTWMTPWEMADDIWKTRGIRVSDSTITARIRDCRKPQYGNHRVLIRKRSGSKAYEYKIEK